MSGGYYQKFLTWFEGWPHDPDDPAEEPNEEAPTAQQASGCWRAIGVGSLLFVLITIVAFVSLLIDSSNPVVDAAVTIARSAKFQDELTPSGAVDLILTLSFLLLMANDIALPSIVNGVVRLGRLFISLFGIAEPENARPYEPSMTPGKWIIYIAIFFVISVGAVNMLQSTTQVEVSENGSPTAPVNSMTATPSTVNHLPTEWSIDGR